MKEKTKKSRDRVLLKDFFPFAELKYFREPNLEKVRAVLFKITVDCVTNAVPLFQNQSLKDCHWFLP
jgi:hypothetical protein